MSNPRKGEPGHRPELRERHERTPTKREREFQRRIRVEIARKQIAGSFLGRWGMGLATIFGEYATLGRGRFATPTKGGPGRRPDTAAKRGGLKLFRTLHRGHRS